MKITVVKGSKKLNIDSVCLPAWENAGWKKADEKAEKTVKKADKASE